MVVLALLASLTGSAEAQDACRAYADTAVAQHETNRENGCGFAGVRWHTDRRGHETFCRVFGPKKADEEAEARQASLDGCIAKTTDEAGTDAATGACRKSEIAEGEGATTQAARAAAQDKLGFQRAQMINDGYPKCLFHQLGCTGGSGARTCWLSVSCCVDGD
ncbi:hypothetical protein [Bauldia sp.]|uniref:hypothetical protein n=1 Tax=Bauldia sp. TaxID=2575872 RepID=UPI003BA8D0E4